MTVMPLEQLQAAPLCLAPASAFSIEQLTAAYNQTRVDYLVPMPMNAARLAEYIRWYDVDLDRSVVATEGEEILGLGMLGVRCSRAWATRLGVLPSTRRRGIGEHLTRALLTHADQLGIDLTILEVIKNNQPAHALFRKLGFREVRELFVLLRPPGPPADVPPAEVCWLERADGLTLLQLRPEPQAWTNQIESFQNAQQVSGLVLTLPGGERGWLVFQWQKFIIQRLALMTELGDPRVVGSALLAHLYRRYPLVDSHVENIPLDDAHLPAFYAAGFVESFRRIEMHRRQFPLRDSK